KPNTQAVGGARTATQQRLLLHGMPAADNTIDVDGMKMNSMYLGGETQPNHNDAMTQEVTVQTSSPGAEVSAAGVHITPIPRDSGELDVSCGEQAPTRSGMGPDRERHQLHLPAGRAQASGNRRLVLIRYTPGHRAEHEDHGDRAPASRLPVPLHARVVRLVRD